MSVDINAMVRALGGDGVIEFETEDEKGFIAVDIEGGSSASIALKKVISFKVITAALKVNNGE